MQGATYDPTNPGWWYTGDAGVESNWWEAPAPTYDPTWNDWYTGDPSIESNWGYTPPDEWADPESWNFEPPTVPEEDWLAYEPGEQAPLESATFDWPEKTYPGGPPTDQNINDAMGAWMDEQGLGPQPPAEPAAPDVAAPEVSAPPAATPAATPVAGSAEEWAAKIQASFPRLPPVIADYIGEQIATGVVTPAAGANAAYSRQAEIDTADAAIANARLGREDKAAADKLARDLRAMQETGATERGTAANTATVQVAKTTASQKAAESQLNAAQREKESQLNATIAREKIAAEQEMQSKSLASQEAGREKQARLTLIQVLLAASVRGPNAAANRKMALDLLRGMGIDTTGMESTGMEEMGGGGGGTRTRFAALAR